MEIYESENEQILAIKEFLAKYKNLLLTIFIASVVVILARMYWNSHSQKQAMQASDLYQQMLSADMSKDSNSLEMKGQLLLKSYSRTAYAELARLLLAKDAVAKQDFVKAEAYLQPIIDSSPIARLRLAKIVQQTKGDDAALKLIETAKVDPSYLSLYEEAKGDLYASKGDKNLAREAYIKALQNLPEGAQSPLVQMKLMDLGPGEKNA